MSALEFTQTGESVVLVSAVVAASLYLMRTTWKGYRAIVRFFERVEKVMDSVEHQLYPNSGTTLRDAVNRIQEHLGIEDQPAPFHNDRPEQP